MLLAAGDLTQGSAMMKMAHAMKLNRDGALSTAAASRPFGSPGGGGGAPAFNMAGFSGLTAAGFGSPLRR
jgi:hypothetical protein